MTFYSYGTAMMDYFLLYPTRGLVGASEFPAYHTALAERILPVSVFPFLALTVLNLLLFRFRPRFAARGLVAASFICLYLDWLSTVFIQIPLNGQLNERKDAEVMKFIMQSNWARIFLETAQAVIAFVLLYASLLKNAGIRSTAAR